jgi:hypothetical protein
MCHNADWVLHGFLCLALGFLAGSGCAQPEEKPKGLIVLDSEEHDFGTCKQGEALRHEFTLQNAGRMPVKIVEVKTSCGCLVAAQVVGSTVPPGDKLALPVGFTTGGAQETASAGVLVGYRKGDEPTDAGEPKYVHLKVRASILPDYRISPREVDFGLVDGLAVQQVDRVIRVEPVAVADVKLLEASSSNPFLHVQVLPKDSHGCVVQVKVSLDVSGFTQSRPFTGSVVFSTDSKRVPKAVVEVKGQYQAPVEIQPDAIVIASDERGEVERQLQLKASCAARVRQVRFSGDEGIRIEFDRELVAQKHVFHLFVAPCKEGRPTDGELEVDVQLLGNGASTFRTLRVPVHRFSQKGV